MPPTPVVMPALPVVVVDIETADTVVSANLVVAAVADSPVLALGSEQAVVAHVADDGTGPQGAQPISAE